MGGPEMRLLQRQLQLPPRGRRFAPLSLQRPERGIDAERFQDPENLGANRIISSQCAKRDASLRSVVHESALAVIAARLAAIAHIQLAAAMAATQEPRQKQSTRPHRASGRGAPLAGRIVGNHLLVTLELAPGDIALVLILEQNIPLRLRAPQSASYAFATVLDADFAHRAPKGIRASIDRVGQDVVHAVVERKLPDNCSLLRRFLRFGRQRDALVAQPDMNLTNALELGEL